MFKKIPKFEINNSQLIIFLDSFVYQVELPYEIKQVEQFDNNLVVRLKIPLGIRFNENIFGISYEGKILWQIEPRKHPTSVSPYTNLAREGDSVYVFNWDGTDLVLDPYTGKILKEGYSK